MRKVCILGGAAALAQPLIRRWTDAGDEVTAICRESKPPKRLNQSVVDATIIPCGTDLLVTVTGTTANYRMGDMSAAAWQRVIDATLTSVARTLCTAEFLKDGANVVVVGSIVGSTGGYGCANYAAAKAGLVGLVRAAANELAGRNICVNLLELGYVDAGMGARLDPKVKEAVLKTIPLRRFATEAEFVEAVDYLSKVRYMTGSILNLAGGLR